MSLQPPFIPAEASTDVGDDPPDGWPPDIDPEIPPDEEPDPDDTGEFGEPVGYSDADWLADCWAMEQEAEQRVLDNQYAEVLYGD